MSTSTEQPVQPQTQTHEAESDYDSALEVPASKFQTRDRSSSRHLRSPGFLHHREQAHLHHQSTVNVPDDAHSTRERAFSTLFEQPRRPTLERRNSAPHVPVQSRAYDLGNGIDISEQLQKPNSNPERSIAGEVSAPLKRPEPEKRRGRSRNRDSDHSASRQTDRSPPRQPQQQQAAEQSSPRRHEDGRRHHFFLHHRPSLHAQQRIRRNSLGSYYVDYSADPNRGSSPQRPTSDTAVPSVKSNIRRSSSVVTLRGFDMDARWRRPEEAYKSLGLEPVNPEDPRDIYGHSLRGKGLIDTDGRQQGWTGDPMTLNQHAASSSGGYSTELGDTRSGKTPNLTLGDATLGGWYSPDNNIFPLLAD